MPLRPCLDCGALATTTRCPTHQRAQDRQQLQRKRAKRPRISSEDKRRAETVAAWRAEYGDWCPGWQCPSHPAADLTADHVVAVAADGDERGPLSVLCVRCNSRKGPRPT